MKTIKITHWSEIPDNYTGIVEWRSGAKSWFLNGERHREDGPAIEHIGGIKSWILNGKYYTENEHKTKMMSRSSVGKLLMKRTRL